MLHWLTEIWRDATRTYGEGEQNRYIGRPSKASKERYQTTVERGIS